MMRNISFEEEWTEIGRKLKEKVYQRSLELTRDEDISKLKNSLADEVTKRVTEYLKGSSSVDDVRKKGDYVRTPVRCYECKKIGHISRYCFDNARNRNFNKSNKEYLDFDFGSSEERDYKVKGQGKRFKNISRGEDDVNDSDSREEYRKRASGKRQKKIFRNDKEFNKVYQNISMEELRERFKDVFDNGKDEI
ncbi:hypothetical protein NGRA_3391, partial [Nosema granulosis]